MYVMRRKERRENVQRLIGGMKKAWQDILAMEAIGTVSRGMNKDDIKEKKEIVKATVKECIENKEEIRKQTG